MALRCYIPTTLAALATGLGQATAVHAHASSAADRRAEEVEEAEFAAMHIAASLAATDSLAAAEASGQPASPRVVVAYDAPEDSARQPLADGFDLLALAEVDLNEVASFHLDEAEIWDDAAALGDAEAAVDRLGEVDLLWYDRSELDDLLAERS